MREIKLNNPKYRHKGYALNTPSFKAVPKKELNLFIAVIELAAKDYYNAHPEFFSDCERPP